ncbi:MAG: hypothetical protein MJE68_02900 [Proteobacteria bacterium]|nr:hypothetical protein [Pseudomonadota bacterium]
MADAHTQSAPMEATMTVKESTEKRLNTAERKAESADRKADSADRKADVLDASKLSWKRGITIYLTSMAFVLTITFGYLDMRLSRQDAHIIQVEERLRVVEISHAEFKAETKVELKQIRENQEEILEILRHQQEILENIRSQPPSQRAPPAQ